MTGSVKGVVRKTLAILLVILLVVIGVPLPIMGMMSCPQCDLLSSPTSCALLFVAAAALTVSLGVLFGRRLLTWVSQLVDLMFGSQLFRPPQLSFS